MGFVTHKTNVYGNIWIIKKKKRDVEYKGGENERLKIGGLSGAAARTGNLE